MDISFEDEFGGKPRKKRDGLTARWDAMAEWTNPMDFNTYGLCGRACFVRFGDIGADGETVVVAVPDDGLVTIVAKASPDAEPEIRTIEEAEPGDGSAFETPGPLTEFSCESYALAVWDCKGAFRFPAAAAELLEKEDRVAGDLFVDPLRGKDPLEAMERKPVWTYDLGGGFSVEVTVEDGHATGWLARGGKKVSTCAIPTEYGEEDAVRMAARSAADLAWGSNRLADLLDDGESVRLVGGELVVTNDW